MLAAPSAARIPGAAEPTPLKSRPYGSRVVDQLKLCYHASDRDRHAEQPYRASSERKLQTTFAVDESCNALLKSTCVASKGFHQQISVGTPYRINYLVMICCDVLLLPLKVTGVLCFHAVNIV